MKQDFSSSLKSVTSFENSSTVELLENGGLKENDIQINPSQKLNTYPSSTNEKESSSKLFIFDSIKTHFDPKVFIWQLLVHLMILGGILSPNRLAQGFALTDSKAIFNFGLPLFLYLAIISYTLAPSVPRGAIVIPIVLFVQHKLLVAVKYATLSPSEYLRLMTSTNQDQVTRYQSQLQLTGAWIDRDEDVLLFELGAAAVRVGAKISDLFVIIPSETDKNTGKTKGMLINQIRYWHAYLRGRQFIDYSVTETPELQPLENGGYRISVFDLCCTIIRSCDRKSYGRPFIRKIIYIFNFLIAVIPFAIVANSKEIKFSVQLIVFLITSTVVNLFFGFIVFELLAVAVVDHMRQLEIMKEINLFLRLSDAELTLEHMIRLAESDVVSHSRASSAAQNQSPFFQKDEILRQSNQSIDEIFSMNTSSSKLRRRASYNIERFNQLIQQQGIDKEIAEEFQESMKKDQDLAEVPVISLDELKNITSWAYARLVLHNFGERFKFRTSIYIGGTSLLTLLFLILALIEIIQSSNRQEGFKSSFVAQTLVMVTASVLFIIVLSVFSASSNDVLKEHSPLLSRHMLRFRSRFIELCSKEAVDEKEREHVDKLIAEIEAIRDVLDIESSQSVVKIFGVEASSSLTTSIISTIVSFYGTLICLYSSNSQLGKTLSSA